MTRPKRTAALLAVAVLLVLATRASAVTLMVNGNTPSAYWQDVVDHVHVPTIAGRVDLFIEPDSCACTDGHTVWLSPGLTALDLLHELGHDFDFAYLNPQDRAFYKHLWEPWPLLRAGHPARDWTDADAGPDETHYLVPIEHFAEVYTVCAQLESLRVLSGRMFRHDMWQSVYYEELAHGAGRARFARTMRHSCLFLRYIGARNGRWPPLTPLRGSAPSSTSGRDETPRRDVELPG